ncbi:alpha-N-arabinofuranosidase [Solwaraspora sp. WMMD406]|uniref:arabinosylfuranosidase ArfA n=1 Tax=Solwaraspora sp. WMMD406 TaxID=3016095 RepID=UPI00241662B6|nr:alpha-N-arabinofuranosidase [Solwaraspora sp. WMMD406]MDG4766814.1 alpha-N-arabinofuranosidase [Solwaraspora sp. WMMD406]
MAAAEPVTATMHIDPAFVVAPVRRRTFGSFVEHMGRCVYTGIYEPGHPEADERGLRRDVLDLVREQGVTVVRYPGGNFVSGYRWEDGVGPREQRPTRLDPAWHSVETNEFGLDEFMTWAEVAGVEPMMAVNLGTRGPQEAMELLEYANHPGGTRLSDLRRAHGREKPYGIRMWCLGNEMDGPWQLGHQNADEYGRKAAETARAMRMIDPDLELVACGSSGPDMATFGSWEATILEHTYDQVDFVSAHLYHEELDGDLDSFLASSVQMDNFISDIVATCDHVRAKTRQRKRMNISFDEWNVWYMREFLQHGVPGEWVRAPALSEDDYTLADAVVVGSLLITLLRRSDRVTAACQAQLVNTISGIRAEAGGPAWRQTIFYPFAYTARHARGEVLRVECRAPLMTTAKYGDVPMLDAVATHDDDADALTVFAVNRSRSESLALGVDLRAFPGYQLAERCVLTDPDVRAANTSARPDRVRPRSVSGAAVDQGRLEVALPPVSWSMLRLAKAR